MGRPNPFIELRYSGAWQGVTLDVRTEETITFTRGRRNWASVADPAELTLQFNQGASKITAGVVGRYAPRNPRSDLFGLIGRNTPIRVRLTQVNDAAVSFPGIETQVASTPDHASLRLTGDQRFEIFADPSAWRDPTGAGDALARRYATTNANRAWAFWLTSTGTLFLRHSANGLATLDKISTAAVPEASGPLWLAWAIDVDNGAAGHTVTFQTAPDVGGNPGTWTNLGAPITVAGVTSIFASTASFQLGRIFGGPEGGIGVTPFVGRIGAARYMTGALSLVASPDFRTLDPEDTTLTDAQGRVWTLEGGAAITDRSVRFAGEVASWPQSWDLSGRIRSTTVTGAGPLRRLIARITPLKSSLTRDFATKANVAAYWPLEEKAGASRFASGLPDDASTLAPGDPEQVKLAAYEGFAASAPLPTVADTEITGNVPSYTPEAAERFVFLNRIPDAGIATDRHIARFSTSGTLGRWEIIYAAGGGSRFRCFGDDGTLIFDHGPSPTGLDGKQVMWSLWLEQQNPTTTFFQFALWNIATGVAVVPDEGTVPGTFGSFTRVTLGSNVGMDDTVFGHLALMNGDVHSIWDSIDSSVIAWAGEDGGQRLVRLGGDENIPVRLDPGGAEPMGPQRVLPIMNLIREIPAADLGFLGEAADTPALYYRPYANMVNQAPKLVLDYTDQQLAEPFQPVDDDQGTVNSVTATAVTGETFTAALLAGPLSVQPPPDGVGLYDQAVEVNVGNPGRVAGNAGWRLALGTQDESRYPTVRLNLQHPNVAPIAAQVLAVKLGDLIRIENLPVGVPPGPVDLIVDAITDDITPANHHVEFTCTPGTVWASTRTYGPNSGTHAARYDTARTERTAGTITTTQTTISLDTTTGPLWTTAAADFPLDVMAGGERMRVTAIAASIPPAQNFTVVRSVNGVVKTHPNGTTFALADPTRYAY